MRCRPEPPRRVVLRRAARKLHSQRKTTAERRATELRRRADAHRARPAFLERYAARLVDQDAARRKAKAARRECKR